MCCLRNWEAGGGGTAVYATGKSSATRPRTHTRTVRCELTTTNTRVTTTTSQVTATTTAPTATRLC